ncbi:hypothetical protein GOX01_12370 [Gluconobacter oxydans]|nr:hypothetical protein GOX01_12370 [Gluconobacter oxydans]
MRPVNGIRTDGTAMTGHRNDHGAEKCNKSPDPPDQQLPVFDLPRQKGIQFSVNETAPVPVVSREPAGDTSPLWKSPTSLP